MDRRPSTVPTKNELGEAAQAKERTRRIQTALDQFCNAMRRINEHADEQIRLGQVDHRHDAKVTYAMKALAALCQNSASSDRHQDRKAIWALLHTTRQEHETTFLHMALALFQQEKDRLTEEIQASMEKFKRTGDPRPEDALRAIYAKVAKARTLMDFTKFAAPEVLGAARWIQEKTHAADISRLQHVPDLPYCKALRLECSQLLRHTYYGSHFWATSVRWEHDVLEDYVKPSSLMMSYQMLILDPVRRRCKSPRVAAGSHLAGPDTSSECSQIRFRYDIEDRILRWTGSGVPV